MAYDAIQEEIRQNDLYLTHLSGRRDALREMRDRLTAIAQAAGADRAPGEVTS